MRKGIPAKIIAVDAERDLALVRLSHPVAAAVIFRNDVPRLGENIVVAGFRSQAAQLRCDRDQRHRQRAGRRAQRPAAFADLGTDAAGIAAARSLIRAVIFVGVAVASLSTMRLAQATGAIPENINFAVKGDEAKQFSSRTA